MGVVGTIVGIYMMITVLMFSFQFYEDNKELIKRHPILTFLAFTIFWMPMFIKGVIQGIKKAREEENRR